MTSTSSTSSNRSSNGPKVVISNPRPLSPSDAVKSAAKLRTLSFDNREQEERRRLQQTIGAEWNPTSWQNKPIVQDVVYGDYNAVEQALEKLEALPPLVSPYEINQLQDKLRDAALGNAFVLQGGDCAELFNYCSQEPIENKIKVLLQMSLVLIWGTKKPVVRIARIAGQYAKPRSKLTEVVDGKEIPSFRGDNINGFDVKDRTPDPSRLVDAYFHSAASLNYIRSAIHSGFADLHHPFDWNLSHVRSSTVRDRYQDVVDAVNEGISFMKAIGADRANTFNTIDLFTSHEGLLLEYEQSLTRKLRDPSDGQEKYYDTSAHMVWIGDRTRQLDGAHVEFFRGLKNPIGIKVGPSMKAEELVDLLDIVDSDYQIGRVTLICRYGASKVSEMLPGHIHAVKNSRHKVVWMVDPCHGNTKTSPITSLKTRYFGDIMSEIVQSLQIHSENDSAVHGLHLELTGDAVTECIGGSEKLKDEDLVIRYDTVCDPRLSLNQSLDVAFLISDYYRNGTIISDSQQSTASSTH